MDFNGIWSIYIKKIILTKNNPDIFKSFRVTEINYQTINTIWVLVTFFRENAKNHHKMPFWDCFKNLYYENDLKISRIPMNVNVIF